jgi:hypothetical protein
MKKKGPGTILYILLIYMSLKYLADDINYLQGKKLMGSETEVGIILHFVNFEPLNYVT